MYFVSYFWVQSEERIFGLCLTCHLYPLVHYMNLPTFIKLIPHSWIFRLFWVLVITNITMMNIFIAKYLHVFITVFSDYIFKNKIIGDFYLFIIHVWPCHSSRFLLAFHCLQVKALTAWCGVKTLWYLTPTDLFRLICHHSLPFTILAILQ